MDNGAPPPGSGSQASPGAAKASPPPVSIPSAGAAFTIVYPFVRGTYTALDAEGYEVRRTWLPGVEYRDVSPEGTAPFADAEGRCRFTVVAPFKPGHYPTRVFYTRKFIDPDGREFGKGGLRIATLDKFRRLCIGYRDPYGIGDQPPPKHGWSGDGLRTARAAFESLLASGIAARSDETPQAAQPGGQEPGPQGDAK